MRKDAECTFGILKKRRHILKNHMLLQVIEKIDNIVFTCAIIQNMLIEHDKWQDEDEDDDVAANFPELRMDQRIIDLRRSPADRSYVGSGNIDDCDVQVEWSGHSCEEH